MNWLNSKATGLAINFLKHLYRGLATNKIPMSYTKDWAATFKTFTIITSKITILTSHTIDSMAIILD